MTTALSTRDSEALSPLFGRDPFASLQHEMDDLLSRFKADWNGDFPTAIALPAVDLSETNDAIQVRMNVPGMKPEEIEIEASGNTLRLRGEHKEEKEEQGRTFYRRERRSGAFARTLALPAAIKEDKVSAECKDGVLTITLPKTEIAKTHKVKVIAK